MKWVLNSLVVLITGLATSLSVEESEDERLIKEAVFDYSSALLRQHPHFWSALGTCLILA
jgi:hypothetical protein